jgi:transposase
MKNVTLIGIDLAKNIFQVYGEDVVGNKMFNKKLSRGKFKTFLEKLPVCTIGMEACGTAHYWARKCIELGHTVKMINPRQVKPYLNGNKTDAKDAEAICEATRNRKVRAIPIKSEAQQDVTSIHRSRSQLVKRKTALGNQLRSVLAEYGVVTQKGYAALISLIQEVLSGKTLVASSELLFVLQDGHDELEQLKERMNRYDHLLKKVVKNNKMANRLYEEMPGIGEITATALVAKIEDMGVFKHGRDFGAWLGLTPTEHSSAGKRHLGKISKRGDRYLRTLLIHGARSQIKVTLSKKRNDTAYHRWIQETVARIGKNKSAVALANKHARMIWAILVHDRAVDLNFADTFKIAA